MNAPVDVKAATETFLARTETHLMGFLESCIHCGHCADACHFHEATGDARYTPAYKLMPLAKAWRNTRFPFSLFTSGVTEADLRDWEDLLFDSCTMCGRCTSICPMGIDIASVIGQARQAFTAAGLGPGDLHQAAQMSQDKGSPLGLTPEKLEDRVEWLEDEHETEMPIDKEGAEVMLTVSSVETMKYPESLAAMAKILNHAGVNWTLSSKGYESTNFGYLAGRSDIAKTMTLRLVEAAESLKIKTLIIPECGHAYGVLRWGGANVLGRALPFEVRHITEYMADLKRAGRLRTTRYSRSMTYHDPCQISRRGGAASDARYLLEDFAEDFREMTPTGNYNWCCGGGGGVQAIGRAADLRHKVFRLKIDQTEATGADVLVSSCANCRLTMDDSKAALNWQGELGSLVEIIAENLDEG